MDDKLLEYRLEQQAKQIATLESHVETLEQKIALREEQRQKEEKNRLRVGITFLGSIIITLGGVIWNYRTVIFRGLP